MFLHLLLCSSKLFDVRLVACSLWESVCCAVGQRLLDPFFDIVSPEGDGQLAQQDMQRLCFGAGNNLSEVVPHFLRGGCALCCVL